MAAFSKAGEPVTDKRDLAAWFEAGCKAESAFRVGTEHEKFVYTTDDLRPLAYEGPCGVHAFLQGLATRHDWEPVLEDGRLIALTGADHRSITLEPGGQLELSGAPLETLHQTCAEVSEHLHQTKTVAEELGVGMLGLGFQPKWARGDIPWMPKGRYGIMRRYMPTRGGLGIDMMTRTCTVQANYDFSSEADMVRKFRVGLALQPVVTALFANSPFSEGRPNGYLSFRSHVWTDTDPDRCGILPFVFKEGMGFERWTDYLLDVPMYFVQRGGRYIDVAGRSFREFLAGRLPELPGEHPTLKDWEDHATTVFPEVRLKRYIEMRGADGGPWSRLCALPALWTGLLYDSDALDEAAALCADFEEEEHAFLRVEVPRFGLATPFRDGTVGDLAARVLSLARGGLARRQALDSRGRDETIYLEALEEILRSGRTPAEALLAAYHGPWGESVDPLFTEHAY